MTVRMTWPGTERFALLELSSAESSIATAAAAIRADIVLRSRPSRSARCTCD